MQALEHARCQGVLPIVATGRFPKGALEPARQLGFGLPVICADGAALLEVEGGVRVNGCRTLSPARALGELCRRHGLRLFEFSHDALYFDELDAEHLPYVARWSGGSRHRSSARAERVLMSLGLGERTRVERALAAARALGCGNFSAETFELAPAIWALKFRHARASKGLTLLRIARRLGVPRLRIAAVGNGYNDLSLFAAAARSYCMGDAPLSVRHGAAHVLRANGASGGGVAEAIGLLL